MISIVYDDAFWADLNRRLSGDNPPIIWSDDDLLLMTDYLMNTI